MVADPELCSGEVHEVMTGADRRPKRKVASIVAVVELTGSLLNFEAGGLREDGVHDFTGLTRAFLDDPQPDVIAICEAKEWHRDGETPFLTAIRELSVLCGRPYVGELHTGPIGTAIIYDPTVLCLLQGEDPRYPDRRNRARFALRADGLRRFDLRTEHWSYSATANGLPARNASRNTAPARSRR